MSATRPWLERVTRRADLFVCRWGGVATHDHEEATDEGRPVKAQRIERWSLALIAVFMLPTALQATFAPRSWFDDFPLGRGWIAAEGGGYDEHLVRDVGVLFLSLIIVTAWAAWRGEATRAVAIAWIVQGVLHLVYHVGHLDGLGTPDRIALVGSLVSIPLLALVALWAGSSAQRSAP